MQKYGVIAANDYRTIPLTRGKVALVDAADYEWISKHKWYANGTPLYAKRTIGRPRRAIMLHREILGLGSTNGRFVDHINGNSLDNRRINLRVCSRSENRQNCKISRTNRSGFKGVSFHKHTKKYQATIRIDGVQYFLGYRDTAEEAHLLYWAKAQEAFGDFARKA